MDSNDPEMPPGAFEPLIEHVAETLARLSGTFASGPDIASGARGPG
jgi:hypothetical protein